VRQCVKMARQFFLRLSVEVLLEEKRREKDALNTHKRQSQNKMQKMLNKPPRVIVIVNVVG